MASAKLDLRKPQWFRLFGGIVLLLLSYGIGMNQRRIVVMQQQDGQSRDMHSVGQTADDDVDAGNKDNDVNNDNNYDNDVHGAAAAHHRLVLQIQDLYPFDVEDFRIVRPSEDENRKEWIEGGGVVLERKPTADDQSFSTTRLRKCVTVRRASVMNGTGTAADDGGIGWVFVEDVTDFSGLYHMFHYLEFLAVANSVGDEVDLRRKPTRWIHAPHCAQEEVFGSNAESLHYLITQAVFGMGSLECVFQECSLQEGNEEENEHVDTNRRPRSRSGPVQMYGREINDEVVRSIHPSYHDTNTWNPKMTPIIAELRYTAMLEHVDTVVLISRRSCPHGGINKMWYAYMDLFDAEGWHEGIHRAVQQYKQLHKDEEDYFISSDFPSNPENKKIILTYIDRQDSGRVLSETDHEWIIQTFENMEGVDFRHVQMHKYTGIQQMVLAHDSQVLLGCHGNGLTHQLWMKPHSLVVEIFWHFTFQFDYYTAAGLMRHDYVGIFEGNVMENVTEDPQWWANYQVENKDKEESNEEEGESKEEGTFTEESREFLLEKIRHLVSQSQSQSETQSESESDSNSEAESKAESESKGDSETESSPGSSK